MLLYCIERFLRWPKSMRETVPTFSRIEPRQARSTVCNSRQSRSTAVDGVSLNATACEIRYQQLICHAVLHSHAPVINKLPPKRRAAWEISVTFQRRVDYWIIAIKRKVCRGHKLVVWWHRDQVQAKYRYLWVSITIRYSMPVSS